METFLTDLQPGICSQNFGQSQPQLSYQKGSNIKKNSALHANNEL